MDLVIVESPTKAKTLRKFLGGNYIIEASMGHIRDLPKSSMGVDVSHGFEPEYEVVKGKGQLISKLKKAAETAGTIYLATDPDREGEAISWHVKYALQQNGRKKTPKVAEDKFKRVTFHEITKTAIVHALEHPEILNMAMVDAQQARRVVDRLVGYSVSPVLWRKVRRGLSAGRVQSVAVRLIVEREREIKAFIPVEYWNVQATLQHANGFITADLAEVNGKKIELHSSVVVEPIVEDLKKALYTVLSVERKEQQKKPNPPFTTSTLQQAAANVLGWSGKMTMQMAQQLYEAGLITYHRTDSFNLAAEAVIAVRMEIEKLYGPTFIPLKPNVYVTKSKNAQEAHEAIRPTDAANAKLQTLDERQKKLYMLIWRRFMACQMKPAVYDQTVINVGAIRESPVHYKLRAAGSVVKFMGWKKAYEGVKQKEEEVMLPQVQEKEKLDLKEVLHEQKFTEAKARYNDASLIKELEKRGIGRPSTYASIMSTIVDRGYVERLEKRYYPTSVGEAVNDFLMVQFPTMMDYQFTAEMEEDLDRISRGEKDWKVLMKSFWGPFEKLLKAVDKSTPRVEIPVEKTGEKCPKCGEGELVIRSGKFGKFMSCNRFPECDYKASLRQIVDGVQCPDCGKEIVARRTKTGRTFWGCGTYPKCKWASWQDPTKKQETSSSRA
jgi:DNA topoisomerase-1